MQLEPFRSHRDNRSCATISESNPAEPHGNRNRGGNRKCGQDGKGVGGGGGRAGPGGGGAAAAVAVAVAVAG